MDRRAALGTPVSEKTALKIIPKLQILLIVFTAILLGSCSSGSSSTGSSTSTDPGGNNPNEWQLDRFFQASQFARKCVSPRPGSGDINGTALDEVNWVRSMNDDLYYWYDEVADVDPGNYNSPIAYFNQAKTNENWPSGKEKDPFSFALTEEETLKLLIQGEEVGYGIRWSIESAIAPRSIFVVHVEQGSSADIAGISRGMRLLEIDGIDVVNTENENQIDDLNTALYPFEESRNHDFKFLDLNDQQLGFNLTSESIVNVPVGQVKTIFTEQNKKVGYLQFNDHIDTANSLLENAFNTFKTAAVEELILDLRYNQGGLIDVAARVAYMISSVGNRSDTNFLAFEYNDKHPNLNPVTRTPNLPTPFIDRALDGDFLPKLNLSRVVVLTTSNSCSASEGIISGLRGVDIDVIQIGTTTCGKPWGFEPVPNCGINYFPVQFKAVNNKGFGDYENGYAPINSPDAYAEKIPGCYVKDDLNSVWGAESEALLAEALNYLDTEQCQTPVQVNKSAFSNQWQKSSDKSLAIKKARKPGMVIGL